MQALKESDDTIDAFIFGNQALFFVEGQKFLEAADLTPIFSYSEVIVKFGALASLSADDYKLGRMLAGSIIEVLYNGIRIGDIPIKVDNDPGISINISTAEKLGIIIPMHILKVAEVYR